MWKQNYFHNSKCIYILFWESLIPFTRPWGAWDASMSEANNFLYFKQYCSNDVKRSHMIRVAARVHDYIHFGMFSQRRRAKNTGWRKNSCKGIWLTTFKVCKILTQPCMYNVPHWTVFLPQSHPRMMWLLTELFTWSNSSFYIKIHCWSYGSIMYQPSRSQSSCRLPDSCRPLASPEHTFQEFATGRKQCWALQVTGHKVTLSIWSKVLKITCTDK